MHSKSVNNNQATLKHSWSIRKWHEISKVCLALALSILAAGIIFLSLSALPIEASCSFLGCGVLLLVLIHIKKGSSDNSSTPISQGAQPNSLEPNSSSKSTPTFGSNSLLSSTSTTELNVLPLPPTMIYEVAANRIEHVIIGSGKITTRTCDLPEDLNTEVLSLGITCFPVIYTIRQGDKNSIQTVVDDNINRHIYARAYPRLEGRSHLGLGCLFFDAEKAFLFEKMSPSQPAQCVITLKTMFNALVICSPGRTHLTTFSGDKRNLFCSMSSYIGQTQLEIVGQLGELGLQLNGNSTFSGEKLKCDRADLKIFDHSTVTNLNVSEIPKCEFYDQNTQQKGTGSCTYTLPGQPPTVLTS